MARHWIPRRESILVTFSTAFANAISAAPESYGLTPADAADFAALNSAWVNAYRAAVNADTRGVRTIQIKNDAKAAMHARLRTLGMQIQHREATTNAQRIALGLTVPASEAAPVPVPTAAPRIMVERRYNRSVWLRFVDTESPDNAGKPEGALGLALFSWVGTSPPSDLEAWTFRGNTTRARMRVDFPETVPHGEQVWFTAYWFNTKAEAGPRLHPATSCYLDSGPPIAAAA